MITALYKSSRTRGKRGYQESRAAAGPRAQDTGGRVAHRVELIGIVGLPEVREGDDLVGLLVRALGRQHEHLQSRDVLVITQKIVSKAEGRVRALSQVRPSGAARRLARAARKDPRLVELILAESKRIVRMAAGVLITETRHGFVCANAGVDQSNVKRGYAALLPNNPDRSARVIQKRLGESSGADVAVVISDTFGRPWREGQTDVAIGVAGLSPLKDYRGERDQYGYELKVTAMAVADELASAAELIMGKTARIPAVIIRGYRYLQTPGSARELVRKPARDLFR